MLFSLPHQGPACCVLLGTPHFRDSCFWVGSAGSWDLALLCSLALLTPVSLLFAYHHRSGHPLTALPFLFSRNPARPRPPRDHVADQRGAKTRPLPKAG